MFEQATTPPGPAFGYAAAVPPPPAPVAGYELRPLSTGEILDRTFSMYRRRFWLYCGLSALTAALGTISQLIQMIWMGTPSLSSKGITPAATPSPRAAIISGVSLMVIGLVTFVAYSITQAATISAVSAVYLGHETSMATALRAVRRRWYRYALIALWQAWSAIWVPMALFIPALVLIGLKTAGLEGVGYFVLFLAFASLVYGLIAYIRNTLGIAASVFEDLKVRPAMRRSKTLVAGHKWRMFLLLFMMLVLRMVGGALQTPFAFFLIYSHAGQRIMAQGLSLIVAFVTNSLIFPVGAIAFCLFYIDERVRKEGFDIEALMDRTLGSAGRVVPVAEAPVLLPSGFAPSGFTAAPPPPSPYSALSASPFAPSGFTGGPPVTPPTVRPVPSPHPPMPEPTVPEDPSFFPETSVPETQAPAPPAAAPE